MPAAGPCAAEKGEAAMTTMTRFVSAIGDLHTKLEDAQAKYERTVIAAEQLAQCTTAGKFVYIPDNGGGQVSLEVSDETREALLRQASTHGVNEAVGELYGIWQHIASMAYDAINHIDAARKAAIQEQSVPAPPSRVVNRQPVTTAPTEAVTMTQSVSPAVPPRVRRI